SGTERRRPTGCGGRPVATAPEAPPESTQGFWRATPSRASTVPHAYPRQPVLVAQTGDPRARAACTPLPGVMAPTSTMGAGDRSPRLGLGELLGGLVQTHLRVLVFEDHPLNRCLHHRFQLRGK